MNMSFASAATATALLALVGCSDRTPENLVYFQRFEDATLADSAAKQENGRIGKGEITSGKVGNALHIPAGKPGAIAQLPAGAIGLKGCVEFWAKIDKDGETISNIFDPMFFRLSCDDIASYALGMSANEGHGMSGLQFHTWGMAYSASHKNYGILPLSKVLDNDPLGWHHYALVWNFDIADEDFAGKPLTAFIDGKPRYEAEWQGGKPTTQRYPKWLKGPMDVDFSFVTPSHCGYTIDEFKIWSTDKRQFEL